jgi:acyl-CoA hydrolase
MVSEDRLAAVLGALPEPPRVVAGGNFATPWRALAVLDAAVAEYRLFMLNAQPGVPDRDGVILESPFIGPGMRNRERLSYIPCRLSLVPVMLTTVLPPDVVLVQVSAPADGTVSLGTEVNVLPAAIEAARSRGGIVVAQVNSQMPYTYGDAVLPVGDIDYGIEADGELLIPAPRPPAPASAAIGERVAALVVDGATLQLGIGGVPDAVLAALTGRRGLAVWSEMFSDGVLGLAKAGALDDRQPVIASFAFGGQELYGWMDRNPGIRMLRTETVNDPATIARRPRMTSVNAGRVRGVIYSGFGGQTDFVVGSLHSRDGKAIIALPSWHPKANVSTVVPRLAGPVTSFQHSFIVSDQGTAAVWGHDASAQATAIIDRVAHPDARDELRTAGRELGFRL